MNENRKKKRERVRILLLTHKSNHQFIIFFFRVSTCKIGHSKLVNNKQNTRIKQIAIKLRSIQLAIEVFVK